MKKFILIIPIFLLLIGCSNKVEDDKFAYIEYKNNLEAQEEFADNESLDFNTFFNIEREGDNVKYSLVINNPKVNMYKIKALVIHNYDTIDIFPSVGIFDETRTLLSGSNDEIKLEGNIVSSDDLSGVNFKLYLEYENDDNEKQEIYYEVKRG